MELTNALLELLNKRNNAAFETVFNLYYPRLVYFAKEYVPAEEAKCLVQNAFISFWEKHPSFNNPFQLQSYFYTSVKNNCLMYLRRQKVKKRFENKRALALENYINTTALEQLDTTTISFQEINTIIDNTVNALPPRCREIFLLSRYEQKTNQKVADELNISVKAVEAQISKALRILRVALKDYLPIITISFLHSLN